MAVIVFANEDESSYAEEIGTFLSNEFTNNFIALIDENPTVTVGEAYTTLKKNKHSNSYVCFYGYEPI